MAPQPAPARLEIAPKYLLILLLPILVLIASEYVLGNFGDTAVDLGQVVLVEQPHLAELAGRYRFLSAFLFYIAVSVVLIAIFAAYLWSQHTRASILRTLCGLVVVIAISLVFSTFEPAWMGSFESYQLVGEDLFRRALGAGQLPFCAPPRDALACGGAGAFFGMTYLLDKINLASSLAAAAVIAGMVLALSRSAPPDLATAQGLQHEGAALQAAQAVVRRNLYASGILLSMGMIVLLAWMNWPRDLIADDVIREDYGDLVQSISLFRGVTYSVLILSYYMPVSLILMVRIDRYLSAAQEAGLSDTPDIKGFDIERIGSMDAFKAILSIASPILASAVGSVISVSAFG